MLLARLPLLLSVILILSLTASTAWQLDPLYEDIFGDNSPMTKTPKSVITNTLEPIKPTRNISSFKLFGDSNEVAKKAPVVTKNLPKTKLKLTLTGVSASKISEHASALIQGPNKETLNYKVDDELPGGAILKEVFSDRVVLERAGRLENLVFVETKGIGIEQYHHPDDEDQENDQAAISKKSAFPHRAPVGKTPSPQRTLSIKERMSKLRKRIVNKNRP